MDYPSPVEESQPAGNALSPAESKESFVVGLSDDYIRTPKTDPDKVQRDLFHELIKDEIKVLDPIVAKRYIVNPEVKARVGLFLLIVSGLPDSKKTTALKALLKKLHIIPQGNDDTSDNDQLSVSMYCALSGQKPLQKEIIYFDYPQADGYSLVIHSAIESIFRKRGERLVSTSKYDESLFQAAFTPSERLNKHFLKVFTDMCDITSQERLHLKDWKKSHANGLVLINIWDVGFSKVAAYILPQLAGHLSNSYIWMFLDLLRDIDHLYESPDIPKNRYGNDGELIMKWRARIHYLLRLAKLASNSLDEKKRLNVCQVIASLESSSDDVTSKIEQLKEQVETVAKRMKVYELIDTENITVFDSTFMKEEVKKLKQLLEAIICDNLYKSKEVPLSFMFLRSAFYTDELLYIRKEELQEFANELQISSDRFKEFCHFFTSIGSIIDVSLIDESSDLIILKPVHFINELAKLFYPSSEVDPLVAKYGIVTVSTAEAIFGQNNAPAFMSFLESLKIAVKLKSIQLDVSLQDSFTYYIPMIRKSPPVLDSSPTAIHFLRDMNTPLSHLDVLFTKMLLNMYPETKLEMSSTEQHINVVRFRLFTPSSTDGVVFELVYLGDAVEFRLPDDNKDEEVCQQIIDVCHNIMRMPEHEDIRYNFAIMCSLDDQQRSSAYKLTRPRHLLPYKEHCTKCNTPITPAIKTWNSILETNKVPEGQRLNGDPLTSDEASSFCVKMEKLSKNAADALADALCQTEFSSFCKNPDKKNWRHFMKMLLQWEVDDTENEEPKSKKELYEILYRLSKEPTNNLTGEDRVSLEGMARSI